MVEWEKGRGDKERSLRWWRGKEGVVRARGVGRRKLGEERTEDTLGRTSLLAALSLEGPEELEAPQKVYSGSRQETISISPQEPFS